VSVPASPATAVSGPLPDTLLNAYKSNVDWLMNATNIRPYCNAYNNAGLTLTAATLTVITLDSETEDNTGMHTGTNGFFTVATAGVYQVIGSIEFPSTASGSDATSIYLNSSLMSKQNCAAIAATHGVTTSCLLRCAVSDTITLKGASTSGGALSTGAGNTYLQAIWIME